MGHAYSWTPCIFIVPPQVGELSEEKEEEERVAQQNGGTQQNGGSHHVVEEKQSDPPETNMAQFRVFKPSGKNRLTKIHLKSLN